VVALGFLRKATTSMSSLACQCRRRR
jgi:hypothetical protein